MQLVCDFNITTCEKYFVINKLRASGIRKKIMGDDRKWFLIPKEGALHISTYCIDRVHDERFINRSEYV